MYVTGQHKNKQISDRLEYITHLHQHTWSIYTQLLRVQNVHTKAAKSAKINVPRIFPRLQYMAGKTSMKLLSHISPQQFYSGLHKYM